MQGKHPITGKPIRIMQTETHLYRDKKTLVFLTEQKLTQKYSRWETITTREYLDKWTKALGHPPTLFVCDSTDFSEVKELLDSGKLDGIQLLFFRRDPLMEYGKEALKKAGYQNIVCIEEIQTMYPHTFMKWSSGSIEGQPATKLEEIVLAIGILFRMQRIVGFTENQQANLQSYKERLQHLPKLHIGGLEEQPEELWLIQQYFFSGRSKRDREIAHCLKHNLANPYIDKVILLNEDSYENKLPSHEKLQEVVLGHRMKYWDVLNYIQKEVPKGVLVAFANSDIYLDQSWHLLWSTNLQDKFLSLLRYEEPTTKGEEPKLFGPRPDSQDTWCLLSDSLHNKILNQQDFDFEFGRAGCDNAINLSMLRAKFVVCNPCLSLRTMHCHHSAHRTYDPKDIIDKPMYLFLTPTGLHDMQPLTDLKAYEEKWEPSKPFSRKLNGDKKELRTFTTMLAKDEVFIYEPDEENRWLPSIKEKETVYKFTNATQTHTGLTYDANRIFLGPHESLKEAWGKFNLSQLTPSLNITKSVAVPIEDTVVKHPYKYMHDYLSKVLRLRDQGYKGEFWVPRAQAAEYEAVLRQFGWEDSTIPIMPRTQDIQAFSHELYMLAPSTSPGLTREEVAALRNRLKGWVEEPTEQKTAVIFQDDDFYDVRDAAEIEKILEEQGFQTIVVYPERTSFDRILTALLGASLVVSQLTDKSLSHYLYWLLPKGAKVIEGQSELLAKGEGAHEAGAAELEYWYFSMPRGKKDALRPLLLEKIKKIVQPTASLPQPSSPINSPQKPLLILPTKKEGFQGHPGDSFRELARMWFIKGYVNLQESSSADFCWLGGVGETLLYDRPNYRWLNASQEGKSYRMALVGNPEPLNTAPMRDWTFWARRPQLLEEYGNKPAKTYNEREKNCVFYGKTENNVQAVNRSKEEWCLSCDDWFMASSEAESYKFNHREYLEALSNSKFGLCLAGYGNKCHREVECMGLGTVPICSPEVDMTNYANQPQEGVHYFRVKTATEARIIAETTTEEEWAKMSAACRAWWRENASCEGSWLLTKRLAGISF